MFPFLWSSGITLILCEVSKMIINSSEILFYTFMRISLFCPALNSNNHLLPSPFLTNLPEIANMNEENYICSIENTFLEAGVKL